MTSLRTAWALLLGSLLLALTPSLRAQSCEPGWDVQFGQPGADNEVLDSIVFDDGSGPALYVCGRFTSIGGVKASGIAKWNGRRWSEVGGGLTAFRGAGAGLGLAIWDDGSGPALYVGGRFDHAGDVPANNIARWDGREWSALGSGTDGGVWELCPFDDGRGSALYVGGEFDNAGNEEVNLIARWDGQAWSAPDGVNLIRGTADFAPMLEELVVFDDGSGPALYMSGNIQQWQVGLYFLRWDGHEVTQPPGLIFDLSSYPETMTVEDDGGGLWIGGGAFWIGDYETRTSIARWDGRNWSAPSQYPSYWIFTLTSFNDGYGEALYVGGDLRELFPEREAIQNLLRWSTPHVALDHTPLMAGEPAQFGTTCSTPGRRVAFAYSTRGLGHFYVEQLGVTLDLNHPQLAGVAVADAQGRATLIRTLPPHSSGRTLWMQAAEQGRKSEVVEATVQ